MTVVFSDANRIIWFVCTGQPSKFCKVPVERGLVSFQRAGRKDMVLARGTATSAVDDPSAARAVFERCPERHWSAEDSEVVYRIEDGAVPGGSPAYRLTSEANVHVLIPTETKPVGLLTDGEIAKLVKAAF